MCRIIKKDKALAECGPRVGRVYGKCPGIQPSYFLSNRLGKGLKFRGELDADPMFYNADSELGIRIIEAFWRSIREIEFHPEPKPVGIPQDELRSGTQFAPYRLDIYRLGVRIGYRNMHRRQDDVYLSVLRSRIRDRFSKCSCRPCLDFFHGDCGKGLLRFH